MDVPCAQATLVGVLLCVAAQRNATPICYCMERKPLRVLLVFGDSAGMYGNQAGIQRVLRHSRLIHTICSGEAVFLTALTSPASFARVILSISR